MSEVLTVEDRVKQVVRSQMALYGMVPDVIDNNYRLADDAQFDSLDLVEMAIGLEDEFGIEIPDESVWAMTTVQSVIDCVTAKA